MRERLSLERKIENSWHRYEMPRVKLEDVPVKNAYIFFHIVLRLNLFFLLARDTHCCWIKNKYDVIRMSKMMKSKSRSPWYKLIFSTRDDNESSIVARERISSSQNYRLESTDFQNLALSFNFCYVTFSHHHPCLAMTTPTTLAD